MQTTLKDDERTIANIDEPIKKAVNLVKVVGHQVMLFLYLMPWGEAFIDRLQKLDGGNAQQTNGRQFS
jgi:hypothetical protein